MKTITVTIDDETYCRAGITAAEIGTSLPALVRQYLIELAAAAPNAEQLRQQERQLRQSIEAFAGGIRLSRDEVHDRGRLQDRGRNQR